ncbi:hypothetical protein OSB04_006373 [Centaurea solstitialis]|uniref:Uncharacterized protein n=1 Tax=Centaurea solstitialis TaxID=347529 RepID=A0AA38TQD5_9ASTR|nr:hypothetical protein OSB04_006373 [Centaurea solstitialis]
MRLRFRSLGFILYACYYHYGFWVVTDRRSTMGFYFFLGESLISRRSKNTELEYRALADTSQELIWLRWILSDMGAPQLSPTLLWCDNNSAI